MSEKDKLFKMLDKVQEDIEYLSKQIESNKDDKTVADYLNIERRECIERRSTLFDVLDIFGWFYDYHDYLIDRGKIKIVK